MLEHDTIGIEQANVPLKLEPELNVKENKKCKIEVLKNSAVNANKVVKNQLLGLYYLVSSKRYSKVKESLELILAIMHF